MRRMSTGQTLHLLQGQSRRPQLQPPHDDQRRGHGDCLPSPARSLQSTSCRKAGGPRPTSHTPEPYAPHRKRPFAPEHPPGPQGLGYIIAPETSWPQAKQTPNHYSFRTVYIQIGVRRKLRYQVHTDPGNGRYMHMAEEVWKLDLRVWKRGTGSTPNERSVGDVAEMECSVACLAPYFSSTTTQIATDSMMGHWLGWSEDIVANILGDDTQIPVAPLSLGGDFIWAVLQQAEEQQAKRTKLEQPGEPPAGRCLPHHRPQARTPVRGCSPAHPSAR